MTPFSLHGIGVSNGIAIGKAHLISNALLEVVQYDIDIKNIPHEVFWLFSRSEQTRLRIPCRPDDLARHCRCEASVRVSRWRQVFGEPAFRR